MLLIGNRLLRQLCAAQSFELLDFLFTVLGFSKAFVREILFFSTEFDFVPCFRTE